MKENLISLAKLLATDDSFNFTFFSRPTDTEKYELAKTKVTNLSRKDLSEFLEKLNKSKKSFFSSLSNDELALISGGVNSNKLIAIALLLSSFFDSNALQNTAYAGGNDPLCEFTTSLASLSESITKLNNFYPKLYPDQIDTPIISSLTENPDLKKDLNAYANCPAKYAILPCLIQTQLNKLHAVLSPLEKKNEAIEKALEDFHKKEEENLIKLINVLANLNSTMKDLMKNSTLQTPLQINWVDLINAIWKHALTEPQASNQNISELSQKLQKNLNKIIIKNLLTTLYTEKNNICKDLKFKEGVIPQHLSEEDKLRILKSLPHILGPIPYLSEAISDYESSISSQDLAEFPLSEDQKQLIDQEKLKRKLLSGLYSVLDKLKAKILPKVLKKPDSISDSDYIELQNVLKKNTLIIELYYLAWNLNPINIKYLIDTILTKNENFVRVLMEHIPVPNIQSLIENALIIHNCYLDHMNLLNGLLDTLSKKSNEQATAQNDSSTTVFSEQQTTINQIQTYVTSEIKRYSDAILQLSPANKNGRLFPFPDKDIDTIIESHLSKLTGPDFTVDKTKSVSINDKITLPLSAIKHILLGDWDERLGYMKGGAHTQDALNHATEMVKAKLKITNKAFWKQYFSSILHIDDTNIQQMIMEIINNTDLENFLQPLVKSPTDEEIRSNLTTLFLEIDKKILIDDYLIKSHIDSKGLRNLDDVKNIIIEIYKKNMQHDIAEIINNKDLEKFLQPLVKSPTDEEIRSNLTTLFLEINKKIPADGYLENKLHTNSEGLKNKLQMLLNLSDLEAVRNAFIEMFDLSFKIKSSLPNGVRDIHINDSSMSAISKKMLFPPNWNLIEIVKAIRQVLTDCRVPTSQRNNVQIYTATIKFAEIDDSTPTPTDLTKSENSQITLTVVIDSNKNEIITAFPEDPSSDTLNSASAQPLRAESISSTKD